MVNESFNMIYRLIDNGWLSKTAIFYIEYFICTILVANHLNMEFINNFEIVVFGLRDSFRDTKYQQLWLQCVGKD